MAHATSVKQELRRLIEEMTEEEAMDLLDFINLYNEPDVLSPEEEAAVAEGKAQIERGEYITGEELMRELGFPDEPRGEAIRRR